MNVPSCENCRFFVQGRYPRTSTCLRYVAYRGRGKLVYEFTDSVRFDTRKCGPEGRLFEPNEKNVSKERHNVLIHLMNEDE